MAVKTISFMLPWVDPLSANSNLYNAGLIARIETSIADRAIAAGKALEINANIFDQQLNTTDSPTFAGLTVDTNTLFVDAVNNRVGIRTASPAYELDVDGVARFSQSSGNGTIRVVSSTTGTSAVYLGDTAANANGRIQYNNSLDLLQLFASNTAILNANSTGVGIGTTSPTQDLHVQSTGNPTILLKSTFSGGSSAMQFDNAGDNSIGRFIFSKAGVTAGGIKYDHATGGAAQYMGFNVAGGADKMTLTGAGRLGLNTTSPAHTFHVVGSTAQVARIQSTSTAARLVFADAGSTSVFNQSIGCSGDAIQIVTGNASRVTVDGSGNAGIGTTSPSQRLDVSGGNIQIEASTTGSTYLFFTNETSGERGRIHTDNAGVLTQQASAGTFLFRSPSSEFMRINALGNVGIGTTSPSYTLDVAGTTYATNFRGPDTGYTIGGDADNLGAAWQIFPTAGQIRGYINGAEAVRLTSTGLGIGTTSPDAVLHANSGATNLVAKFESTDATVTLAMVDNTTTTTGNGPNVLVRSGDTTGIYSGGSERVTILGTGAVGIGTGSPSAKLHVNGNARVGSVAANTSEVGLVSTGSNTYAAGLQVRNYSAAGWARMDWYHQSADNPALLYQISNGSLYFRNDSTASTPFLWNVGSTTAMVLNSSGNVGLGTQSANRRLTVRSPSANTTVLAVQNNDNTSEMFTITETSAKHGRLNLRDATNTTNVEIQASGPSYFNGGNVGIGTTNPGHELEVANASSPTIRINDTGGTSTAVSAWIEGAYAGTQAWFVGMNTSGAAMTITNYLNGPMTFGTNGVERLRMDGNTGSTGGTGSAGAGKQYVELNINGQRYKLLHDGTL